MRRDRSMFTLIPLHSRGEWELVSVRWSCTAEFQASRPDTVQSRVNGNKEESSQIVIKRKIYIINDFLPFLKNHFVHISSISGIPLILLNELLQFHPHLCTNYDKMSHQCLIGGWWWHTTTQPNYGWLILERTVPRSLIHPVCLSPYIYLSTPDALRPPSRLKPSSCVSSQSQSGR